jgi:hypothetical protein
VLPDWFDFHALQLSIAGAMLLTSLSAILAVALIRTFVLRAGLAVVMLGMTVALFAYYQGPVHRGEQQCSFRFLKSDLAIDGCANPSAGTAQGAAR